MNFLQRLMGQLASPENHKLLRAINRAAQERTPESRTAVHRELLLSTLYIAVPAPIDGVTNRRWTTLKEEVPIQYLSIRNSAGEMVIPVFTDELSLQAWKPNAIWIAMPARTLFSVLLQSEAVQVVVNPGGTSGGILSRAELEVLAAGAVPQSAAAHKIPAGTRVQFKQPAKPLPSELAERIKTILEGYPVVAGAYLMQLSRGDGVPSLALGLQMGQGTVPDSAMIKALGECISPALSKNEPLDFVPLNGTLLETIEKAIPALYRRC